jgi:hypothetical protein
VGNALYITALNGRGNLKSELHFDFKVNLAFLNFMELDEGIAEPDFLFVLGLNRK